MSVGLGVFLIALGAILSFAVKDSMPGINLVMVGYICMGAGVATIILSFVLANQAKRRSYDDAAVDRREDPYGR